MQSPACREYLYEPLCIFYPNESLPFILSITYFFFLTLKRYHSVMNWFYVSTWLGHGVPRFLVKHYSWICLWGCFWMRLTFRVCRLSQADCPPPCGWISPSPSDSCVEQRVGWGRIRSLCLSSAGTFRLLECLDWSHMTNSPGSPACRWSIL